jgi:hypothetical protein
LLSAEDNLAVLIFDVKILLHQLGDPQVAERLARGLHRGGGGVFPGLSARPITSITGYTLLASSLGLVSEQHAQVLPIRSLLVM